MPNSLPIELKIFRLAFALLCLVLVSCNLTYSGFDFSSSIDTDGNNLVSADPRLYGNTYSYPYLHEYGKPYYFSDDEVFYVDSGITRKGLDQAPLLITPDSLQCTDKRWLAINPELRMLYFAANGDLYECGFNGQPLRNLTPDNTSILQNPTLSEDYRYISAIIKVNGSYDHIVRLDLQTLELTETEGALQTDIAWYNSYQNDHYYFSQGKLYRKSQNSEPECLMQCSGTVSIFDASHDRRYFALLAGRNLKIYDSLLDTTIDLGECENFAFLPRNNGLIVSKVIYEMADLRLYDPESWEYHLVYDGISGRNFYIGSLDAIDPRWDGTSFFFRGFSRQR